MLAYKQRFNVSFSLDHTRIEYVFSYLYLILENNTLMRGERWLWCIVLSQRSQTLAQITTQLYDGASRTISKRIVQLSLHRTGFESRRPMRAPLLIAHHWAARLTWARHEARSSTFRDCRVEDWKRIARSDESRLRLLIADERLRIRHAES
ncbi:HTH_Tnp_Tc3_2 domain-containing protein [Trichonephila clavipes]|nr:HTH_Tnp_Tc3_2 domain-containing protein [Trichonephila clavipes]